MDINKLFEESNKDVLDRAKQAIEFFSKQELDDIDAIFQAYPNLKNKNTTEDSRTLAKRRKKVQDAREDFVSAQEPEKGFYSPANILERKKAGIEPLKRKIDVIKKYSEQEIITLLRGYATEVKNYNMMLEGVLENHKDKTISNVYNGNEIFDKYDYKTNKIISIIKALDRVFTNLIAKVPKEDYEDLEYSKKMFQNIYEAWKIIQKLVKQGNYFKDTIYNLEKNNEDKIKKIKSDIEKIKKEEENETDPEEIKVTNDLLKWMEKNIYDLKSGKALKHQKGKTIQSFEEDIEKSIKNYLSCSNAFINIISKKNGQITKDLKQSEENLKRNNIEIEELEKNPHISNLTDEDYKKYYKALNSYNKQANKFKKARGFVLSGEYNKFLNKIKEAKDYMKKVGVNEEWFKTNFWKVFYGDKKIFDILIKIFDDKSIRDYANKQAKRVKDTKEYKTIKQYLGDKDAATYLRTYLTLDYGDDPEEDDAPIIKTKQRKEAEKVLKMLYNAAKEAKDSDPKAAEEKMREIEKENQEEYNKDSLHADDSGKYKDEDREEEKDIEQEQKDKKKKKTKEEEQEEISQNNPMFYSRRNLYGEEVPGQDEFERKNKTRILLRAKREDLLNKFPVLSKQADYLFNPEKGKRSYTKEFNIEKEKLEAEIRDLNKEIEKLDKKAKDEGYYKPDEKPDLSRIFKLGDDFDKIKGEPTFIKINRDPDLEDVKKVSEDEKAKIKSDFDKLYKYARKYMISIKQGRLTSSFKEDSEKRDVKVEFKIKKHLINLIKRIYEKGTESYDDLIKETQKYVEPYQPKMARNRKLSKDVKVGNIKERQEYKFSDIIKIFKHIEKTIDVLKNYSSKVFEKESNIEKNKKYKEYFNSKKKIQENLQKLKTASDIFKEIESYMPKDKKSSKKINEDTLIDRAMSKFLADLKG